MSESGSPMRIGFYESVGQVKLFRSVMRFLVLTVSLTGTSFYPHSL